MKGRQNDRRRKQTYRLIDRKTDNRHKNSESVRPTELKGKPSDRQAQRKTDRQNEIERQTDIQIDRQTER